MFLNRFLKGTRGSRTTTKAATPASRQNRVRLRCDGLEDRVTPANANIWTNATGDYQYATAGDWSLGHAPQADEIATFTDNPFNPLDTGTVNVAGNLFPTVYGIDIQSNWSGALELNGTTLTVTNSGSWMGANTQIKDGSVDFLGQGGGTFTWGAGTLTTTNPGSGVPAANLTIEANGNLNITGDVTLDNGVLSSTDAF